MDLMQMKSDNSLRWTRSQSVRLKEEDSYRCAQNNIIEKILGLYV